MTPRRTLLTMLALAIASSLIMMLFAFTGNNLQLGWIALGATLLLGLLVGVHMLGQTWVPQGLVVVLTLLTILAHPTDISQQRLSYGLFIPTICAAILLPWYWSIGAFVVTLLGFVLQTGAQGPLFEPVTLALACLSGAGIAFAGFVARYAQQQAEAQARSAAQEHAQAEAQVRELQQANQTVASQFEQQRELLELVTVLETPAVPLADGVLFAPIVGHMDSRRAQALTTRLLETASSQRARMVILDIAGVTVMDTAVAKALLHTAQALRLLGCEVTISGISATIAVTLIQLGINLNEVRTARSPQEALVAYLGTAAVSTKGNASTNNN